MADARSVVVRFLGDSAGLDRAANDGANSVSKFSDKAKKAAKVAMVGVAAAGAAAVAFIKGGVEGIREGEEAEAKFAQVMSKVPKAMQGATDSIKAHAEEIQKNTRFSYEDALATSSLLAANDGLQKAVKAGVTTVEDATSVTLDLATAQGIDGTAAAKQLAKWMAAPEKAAGGLLKAGIKLTTAEKDKIKAWVEGGDTAKAQGFIMDKLKEKTDGAAKAAGETTAGQMARAQAAFGEVQETLAAKLIPILTTLMGWFLKVAQWAEANPGKMKAIVIVLGSLAAVIGAVSLAITVWSTITKTAAAVQAAFNAVLAMNPIGLVVLAIVGMGIALVALWKKSETFRDIVKGVFNGIRDTAISAIQFVVDGYLGMIETIIKGGAKAFGWIPGLGPKLKAAAQKFGEFRDEVNAKLDGLKSTKNITVTLTMLKKDWDNRAVDALGRTSYGPIVVSGARAGGGPVLAGRTYLVGERGPELLTMAGNGHVTANDQLGGGDFVVELHGNGVSLDGLIEKVVIRRNRELRAAVARGRR